MFHVPQQDDLQRAQRQFNTLYESEHDTHHSLTNTLVAVGQINKQLRETNAKIESAQADESDLIRRRDVLRSAITQTSLPAATMQEVSGLLERHQLQVIESVLETGSGERAEKALKSVLDLLADKTDSTLAYKKVANGREVYRVRVSGRFQDVHTALSNLASQQANGVPLSLELDPLDIDSSAVGQTMRVWILSILV